MSGVPSPDQLRQDVSALLGARARTQAQIASTLTLIGRAHDEAYGLRRAGEPFAAVGGGTSNPTLDAATAVQEGSRTDRLRSTLRSMASRVQELLVMEQQLAQDFDAWADVLFGPTADPDKAGAPVLPAEVDRRELEEARRAQERRRARGEQP